VNRRDFIMNHYFSGTEPTPAYRAACGNHRDNAITAQKAGAKTLVLTHLLAQIDQPGIREDIVHEIQEVYDGTVIWGEDLMRLGIAGSKVTTIEPRTETWWPELTSAKPQAASPKWLIAVSNPATRWSSRSLSS
jgi:hypothetical protein